MTGGRKAFGQGGYRKSVLEPVLPVSLEIREEQRIVAEEEGPSTSESVSRA